MENDSHFNYPKMHLVTHFHNHVLNFGILPIYSTEIGKSSHRTQIKEGYYYFNRNNNVDQILGYYGRHHAMHLHQENLRALMSDGETYSDNLRIVLDPLRESRPQRPPLWRLRAHEGNVQAVGDV